MEEFSVNNVIGGRLYKNRFTPDMTPQLYEVIRKFLCFNRVQKQLKPLIESEELLIKVNLVDPRPPETGCVNHLIVVKAVMDHFLSLRDFTGNISICEANSYYKGPFIFTKEFMSYVPPSEQALIKAKIKTKAPEQDPYDFGFQLALELSGIKNLIDEYKRDGINVRILNVSKEPVLNQEERKGLINEIENFLGEERIPIPKVRDEIISHIPSIIKKRKLGLISLALAKTHESDELWMTATIKNIAVGFLPQHKKVFMHKDLAKAIVYNYMVWHKGCDGRVFGIVSGPYGMEETGPDWGKSTDFPYIITGSDLLAIDCVTATLMFGKPDLIPQIKLFSLAHNKIGQIPSASALERLTPLTLSYKPPELISYTTKKFLRLWDEVLKK